MEQKPLRDVFVDEKIDKLTKRLSLRRKIKELIREIVHNSDYPVNETVARNIAEYLERNDLIPQTRYVLENILGEQSPKSGVGEKAINGKIVKSIQSKLDVLDVVVGGSVKNQDGELRKMLIERFSRDEEGHVYELMLASEIVDTVLSTLKERIEGMKLPDKRGHYGPHDQMHIQHNIGYNAALTDLINELK